MFVYKLFLLLFVFGELEAQGARSCRYPRLEHGRVRMRQKSKLVKFICFPGYTLVGNKYATCHGTQWDVPLPVCIKPGCTLPDLGSNILAMQSHYDAWVVFFCFPGYELVGSSTILCDGRRWNDTIPNCIESAAPAKLSCDFEDPDICGWKDDDLHDFDWRRYNKKTPSSFLNTGPSFDHTFGEGGSGYYMYIETTSRLENDTARLLSPIFSASLSKDGCFSLFYHMYGQGTGGLRVYQKPEAFSMLNLLQLNDVDRKKYLLFEKWGDQGDFWYGAVSPLIDFSDSFQIVIEGIRGTSYTSDIAVDDVAILQGGNCAAASMRATTPSMSDSCVGRCDSEPPKTPVKCGCSVMCEIDSNCCPDYYEICVFNQPSSSDDMPQTQKLVLSTTIQTTLSTLPVTTPKPSPTTTETTTTSTTKKVVLTTTTTASPTTTQRTTRPTTRIRTTQVYKTTKDVASIGPKFNSTTTRRKPLFTPKTTTKSAKVVTTVKPVTAKVISKATTKRSIEFKKDMIVNAKEEKVGESSGLKTTILTISGLICLAGLVWLVALSRGARGRAVLSRLRGHVVSDPEVRYLNSDVDDE